MSAGGRELLRHRSKGSLRTEGVTRQAAAHPRTGSIDLNLLLYFEALFAEGQVSRAAERVNLSQPAMSLALKRLRDLFGDPLLIRTPHGMVPTARARELIGPVRKMLRQSRELLGARKTVEPAQVTGPFQLVATDYVSSMTLPPLMKWLAKQAPLAQVVAWSANPYQLKRWFEDGKVDVGLGYTELPPPELRIRRLFEERVVCIARKGHSSVKGSITFEQLGRLPHVQVRTMRKPRFAIELEREISARGSEPHINLVVSDFRIALEVVAVTDMISVVPERAARRHAGSKPFQVLPLPFELPNVSFSMVWHERTHRDPLHQWFREIIAAVCSEL